MWNSRNKYGAKKVKDDGYTFDSMKEHRRYLDLKIIQASGEISNLVVHPVYRFVHNGVKIGLWKGDFSYYLKGDSTLTVEDVKSDGTYTAESKKQHRMFKAFYPQHRLIITGLKNTI